MSSAKLFSCANKVEAEEDCGGGGDGSSIAEEVPRYFRVLDSNSDSGSVSMEAEPGFIDFFHGESYEVDTVRDFCIGSNQRVINSTTSGGGFNIWEEDIEFGLGIGSRSGSGDSVVRREIDSGRVEVGTGFAPMEYNNLSQEGMLVDEEFEWENLHNAIEWIQEPVRQVSPSWDDGDWHLWDPNTYGEYDASGIAHMFDNQDGVIMGSPPASKSVVDDLPAVVITSEQLSNGNTIVCAICKVDIVVEEKATRLPCKHYYHGECIVPWLGIRNTCPVCRYELPTDDLEYETNRRR